MLARLQQLTTIGQLLAALAWAVVFWRLGWIALAVAGALLIVLGYVLVLAIEFAMAARISRADPAGAASTRQWLRAWWAEVRIAPAVFCWRQPFRSQRFADRPQTGKPGRRGVVLVHGFVCNRGIWNPWLERLVAAEVPFIAVNLEPVFDSIDRYPVIIEQAVCRLEATTGLAPTLLAHSMGGLAVRAWVAGLAEPSRVHRVVTLGSPHHGTWLARFSRATNAAQMRRHSPWLHALSAAEAGRRFDRFTCYYSHCDNIVFPTSTATLTGADNRHVAGCAHLQLAHHEGVMNEVLAGL